MSFKENLKKKMAIDRLFQTVSQSVGPTGVSQKVDKDGMRHLLALSPFHPEKSRDLELYVRDQGEGAAQILVLDNELPLYDHTTIEDVTLRRSPELKEMVSIRNIIKILNDSDIRKCKGHDTVAYVRDTAIELLDLRYDRSDIEEIARDGVQALIGADSGGVEEALDLFVEILGYKPLPVQATANDYLMFGAGHQLGEKDERFGPVVMYNDRTNVLRLIRRKIPMGDPVARDMIAGVATGRMEPDAEGPEVFDFLTEACLKQQGPTVH